MASPKGPRKKGMTKRKFGPTGKPVEVGPGRRYEDGSAKRGRGPATKKHR